MPRVLYVAAHRPQRSPSQRFRFEQYQNYLASKGFDFDYSWLISEYDDAVFYQPGNLHTKAAIFLKSYLRRWRDVINVKDYDLIFVQREAFMTGSVFFEKQFCRSGAKVIFDFDDAIWHFDVSEANKKLGWLKNPSKTSKIIQHVDHVIAGNSYLADYALRYNDQVTIIPTTIDTEYHKPRADKDFHKKTICIGWTGSLTTVKHFRLAEPVLKRLKDKYGERVSFKVIGDGNYESKELNLKGTPWTLDREVEELQDIDIGIMPLPDDEWAKGKCGFKGLQYMAMEVAPIMSPVGMNTEIVQHGDNGFLADSDDEWFNHLCFLIENPDERERIGLNARQTIIDHYSVESQKDRYLEIFRSLTES